MRDIFVEITNSIAAQLEQGVRPWSKPWTDRHSGPTDLPHNYDGRPYRGANVFWLWVTASANGYASPIWLTFNQAKAKGGAVRKGEKGTTVFFWSITKRKDEKTGEEKKSMFVKTYTVFNVAQCDGLKMPTPPEPRPEPERIAAAETMIAETGAVIRHDGGGRAFYTPTLDEIHLPAREAFMSSDGYYSTAFHELGHWTGHATRLDRKFGARFGDNAYAFEELVAELTSAFVCASQGFATVDRADHAAYLAGWIKVLRADPGAFITAAGAAQKAADLILGTAKAVEAVEDEAKAA
jgi:antirestriction protein ArdC